jgi:hypothetical protein
MKYLAELFLKWDTFQMKTIERIRAQFLHSVTFPEYRAFMR